MGPTRRRLLVAAVLWVATALPAAAQTVPGRAGLSLEAGLRATSLRSEMSAMAGASVLLRPTGPLILGGGGWLLTRVRRIDPDSPGGGLRLRVAYGGVVTGVALGAAGPVDLDVRALWGAGNAKIELPVEKAQIAVDNFFVVEPEVGVTLHVARALAARLSVSYRAVSGVEDISNVTGPQLRGASGTLALVVGPW